MTLDATTPTAAAPTAAAHRGKEKKGKRNDGTRKRGEIDRATTRLEEPPRKLTQSTLVADASSTPAAAAFYAAAAGATADDATRGMDVEEMEQEGGQEIRTSDAELLDYSNSNDSHAEDGDASSAASFSSRPASRSSTDDLQQRILQVEGETPGAGGLPAVPEHSIPESDGQAWQQGEPEDDAQREEARRGE